MGWVYVSISKLSKRGSLQLFHVKCDWISYLNHQWFMQSCWPLPSYHDAPHVTKISSIWPYLTSQTHKTSKHQKINPLPSLVNLKLHFHYLQCSATDMNEYMNGWMDGGRDGWVDGWRRTGGQEGRKEGRKERTKERKKGRRKESLKNERKRNEMKEMKLN